MDRSLAPTAIIRSSRLPMAAPRRSGSKASEADAAPPLCSIAPIVCTQFWDGRAATLEEQAKGPMANPIEMGNTHEALVTKLRAIPGYAPLFKKAFGTDEWDIEHVSKAIATFERTVLSGNSAYDQYKAGKKTAMTPQQVRGMQLFFGKARCDSCHEGINFTTNAYHNLGVGTDKPEPDAGRYVVTKNEADWGAFKTPTLREIARTGPYMHDGSLQNS